MIRFGLLALALPATAHAQDIDSVHTRYDWQKDCRRLDRDAPPDEAVMGVRLVCPGPDGMRLMLADSNARVSMD